MDMLLPPLRVLLVEDHADTAEVFVRLLGDRGFRVTLAASISSAIEQARRLPFDLLLCDVGLPDGDGCQLLARLRGELGMDALLAIAVSGYGQQKDIERARAAGFDAFILKPLEISRLFGLMEEVCRSDHPPATSRREFITVLANAQKENEAG